RLCSGRRRAKRRWNWASCIRCWAGPTARRCSTASRRWPTRATIPTKWRAGRALRAVGRFQEANAAYREAAGALSTDPAVQTAWGELFLDGHNVREALRSFQMAMQADQRWTPALIGAARALADENPPPAVTLARRALEVTPNSVEAQIFLAEKGMDAERKKEAREALDKALAVNPSSLEAHAMV